MEVFPTELAKARVGGESAAPLTQRRGRAVSALGASAADGPSAAPSHYPAADIRQDQPNLPNLGHRHRPPAAPRADPGSRGSGNHSSSVTDTPVTSHQLPERRRRRKTQIQELESIPSHIRDHPHVLRRTNRYVVDDRAPIPRAAKSHTELRMRELPVLDSYTQFALRNEECDEEPTIEQLERTVLQLREMQRQCVLREKYPDAQAACYALWRVKQELKLKIAFSGRKGELEQLICKRNELLALVNSTHEGWDDLIEQHARVTRSHLARLSEEQDEELNEFDGQVPCDLPPLYRRNSVAYHKMRSRQRNLANCERWDEAIELQKVADQIRVREKAANLEEVDLLWRNRRDRMLEKQEILFSDTIERAVLRRDELKKRRDHEIRGQQIRIEGLERQIVAKCEKHGIKQGEINLEMVDQDRVALIRGKESENAFTLMKGATAQAQARKCLADSRRSAFACHPVPSERESPVTHSMDDVT
jgi:hypothetical protein